MVDYLSKNTKNLLISRPLFHSEFKSNDLAGFLKDTSLRAWSGPEGIVQ